LFYWRLLRCPSEILIPVNDEAPVVSVQEEHVARGTVIVDDHVGVTVEVDTGEADLSERGFGVEEALLRLTAAPDLVKEGLSRDDEVRLLVTDSALPNHGVDGVERDGASGGIDLSLPPGVGGAGDATVGVRGGDGVEETVEVFG